MSGKHTPGPWIVHPTSLHPAVRSTGTSDIAPRRICTVGAMNGNPVDKFNANLIAAAPDLLDALEQFVSEFEGCYADGEPAMIKARRAIEKATKGEA